MMKNRRETLTSQGCVAAPQHSNMRRVTVSTQCPMCGAPIDFRAGVNALQCTHCRSKLLVTGRKQLLSYSVTPKIGAHDAVERAKPTAVGARLVTIELYFVPYYRFTAQEFCWQKQQIQRKPPSLSSLATANASALGGAVSDTEVDFAVKAIDWISDVLWPPRQPVVTSPSGVTTAFAKKRRRSPANDASVDGIEIVLRHIDKTFVANEELEGKNLYSVGSRSSVLRLDLFRRKRLETMGKVVAPTLGSDMAIARGVLRNSPVIFHREVVGRMLSLIYFPYWVIEIDRGGTTLLVIIDGISGAIVQRDAPHSLYSVLARSESGDPEVLGFRPLRCPNCGNDLPMHPEDVVFLCGICGRAWSLDGNQMSRVPSRMSVAGSVDAESRELLPFWILEQTSGKKFFIPAFRYRGLATLYRIAARLSWDSVVYGSIETTSLNVRGCYYDEADALRLARLAQVGELVKSADDLQNLPTADLPAASAVLTWFVFERRGEMLLDPSQGLSLYRKLMG